MKIETLQRLKNKFTKCDIIKTPSKLKKCKKFLYKLPEPIDEIERSIFQFLTQRYFQNNYLIHWIEQLISKLRFKREVKKLKRRGAEYAENADAVFFNPLGEKIIPDELRVKYLNIAFDNGYEGMFLMEKDWKFICEVYNRYKNAYFIYKITIKIASYRNLIEKYRPKAIIATSEYSFCSSVLTKFCRVNGVEHINVMHGEKLFDLTSTFFEFDKCYVWGEHYIDLFLSQRAKSGQFFISLPASINFSCPNINPQTDLKVYLSDETDKELRILKNNLDLIISNNMFNINKIKLRKHPLYRTKKEISDLFGLNYEIEDATDCKIEESICDSKFVMARYSTVLLQALSNNIKIIIDDCTSPKLYSMLNLLNYGVCKSKNKILLSELLKKNEKR